MVEVDGDASAGEVIADGMLPAGEADQSDGVDEPVELDGASRLELAGDDRGRSGGTAAVGEELTQVGEGVAELHHLTDLARLYQL
ncbi:MULTISPECIES: hypothetical protein [unclassified Micromonospora]|uniref:hypothetical protein n=1 Tax=Micromonospora sp. NPDC005087 TaxID=3364225 RepID=UPI00369B11FC